MKQELLNLLKELSGIEVGKDTEIILNTLGDQAPIIGKLLTTIKIHHLQKRLNKIEPDLLSISEKVRVIDDDGFIALLKDFLFPDLLQQLLDEDEDNKIGYFLNGFNHVLDERIYDQSKILIYYDTLKKLRYVEIEYLLTFTSQYRSYKYDQAINHNNFEKHFTEKSDFRGLVPTIENKLETMNLIDTGRLVSYDEIMAKMNERSSKIARGYPSSRENPQKTEITSFGKAFVDFFELAKKYNC